VKAPPKAIIGFGCSYEANDFALADGGVHAPLYGNLPLDRAGNG